MLTKFSARLCELRKEKGKTQKEAAYDLNVSQSLLSHYECGIRECKFDFLISAAEYYGVSCDYLLGRSDVRDTSFDIETSQKQWPDDDKVNLASFVHILMLLRQKMDVTDTVHGDRFLWCCALFIYRCIILGVQEGDLPKSWIGENDRADDKFYIKHIESLLESFLQSDKAGRFVDDSPEEAPMCVKTLYEAVEKYMRELK